MTMASTTFQAEMRFKVYEMAMYVRYSGTEGDYFTFFEIHDIVEVCVDPDSLYKPEDDGWSEDVHMLENQCVDVLEKRYPELGVWLERQDEHSLEIEVRSFTREGYEATFGKPIRQGDDGLGLIVRS